MIIIREKNHFLNTKYFKTELCNVNHYLFVTFEIVNYLLQIFKRKYKLFFIIV